MYSRKHSSHFRGFTLIELLVVIAIIAILAAILFPVFAQARAMARKANGLSMVKQVGLSILMYTQDFDERWPRSGWSCFNAKDGSTMNSCGATSWGNVTAPYFKSAQIVEDPADISHIDGDWSSFGNGKFSTVINDLLSHQPCVNGGIAEWGNNCAAISESASTSDGVKPQRSLNLASVNASADCVMLLEGYCAWGGGDGPDWQGQTVSNNKWFSEQNISQYQTNHIAGTNYGGWSFMKGLPTHMDGTNVGYTDGHAKWVKVYSKGGPYNGLLVHSTLPFSKNIDPQQINLNKLKPTDNLGDGNIGNNWQ